MFLQDFYDSNDVRGSIVTLKCVLERARSDGELSLYEHLNNLMIVAMHAKDYEAALLVSLFSPFLLHLDNDSSIF